MRKSLLQVFDKIYIVNLHGSTKRKETAPDGSKDENVFDIQQGVSISIFVKKDNTNCNLAQVYYCDLFGRRNDKYNILVNNSINSLKWTQLECQSPSYFFVPKDFTGQEEYDRGFKINELFSINTSGIKTHHDKELVSFNSFSSESNRKYTYRPFDNRYINYDLSKVVRHRYDVMKYLKSGENISMIVCKQISTGDWNHVFISENLSDMCSISSQTKESGYVFPLFIYEEDNGVDKCVPNLNPQIVRGINESLGEKVHLQELFDYIYAVLHSPSYRERYKEFLKIDFPRIPYPNNAETYHNLASKGAQLRHLHLMEHLPSETGVTFPVVGSMQVDCYRWHNDRVYINADQYFENVPESAWKFHIGGYQPAQKWLKDRKSRTLSFEDVKHYERIIYVLRQTEQIMPEIDALMFQD